MLSALAAAQRRNRDGVSVGNRVPKVVDASKSKAPKPIVKKKASDRKNLLAAQQRSKSLTQMTLSQRASAQAKAKEAQRRQAENVRAQSQQAAVDTE